MSTYAKLRKSRWSFEKFMLHLSLLFAINSWGICASPLNYLNDSTKPPFVLYICTDITIMCLMKVALLKISKYESASIYNTAVLCSTIPQNLFINQGAKA